MKIGDNDDALAAGLVRLARSLQAEPDTTSLLREIVAAALRLFPEADAASISVVARPHHVVCEYASSELARTADEVQTEVEQGPGLDAIYEQHVVRVPDLHVEDRWPEFAGRARELGVGSMLSLRLFVQDTTLGVLTLCSRRVGVFGEESETVGLAFAGHAAVALASARALEHLSLAVDRRDLIGQAKGRLMERHALDAEQAFALLARVSQSSQRKLYDVAREVAVDGTLAGHQQG